MDQKFNGKKYIISFLYHLLSLVIAIVVLSVLAVFISHFFHTPLDKTLLWTGISSGILGVLSLLKETEAASENNNFSQVLSMNFKSREDMAQNYFRLRDSNLGFMLFMIFVGAGLILISIIM